MARHGNGSPNFPSPFAQEYRSLRSSAEMARPLPSGGCRFFASQYPTSNHHCACQNFHHNRSAPGNLCDCGHSACYHVTTTNEAISAQNNMLSTLITKVKGLEDTITCERQMRDEAFMRERQAWEREVRMLRETFAPFYQEYQTMRQKLSELEHRVESSRGEQLRTKEQAAAADDAAAALEKRLEECEEICLKRRRTPTEDERTSTNEDEDDRLSLMADRCGNYNRHPSSQPMSQLLPIADQPTAESPRSSGVLDLTRTYRFPRLPRTANPRLQPPPLSPEIEPRDEARSSGFLALDLVSGLSRSSQSTESVLGPLTPQDAKHERTGPTMTGKPSLPAGGSLPMSRSTPLPIPPRRTQSTAEHLTPFLHPSQATAPNQVGQKRKHKHDLMPLDVLADVSVGQQLIH